MTKNVVYGFLVILFMGTMPVFAQEHQSTNDIIMKMKTSLNLSDDQVANITQIIDRYVDASNDLEQSIEDGTINPSAVDSQRQQIKAAEDQGIAQFLRPDQLYQWRSIQSQMDQKRGEESGDESDDADEYSNLPRGIPSQ